MNTTVTTTAATATTNTTAVSTGGHAGSIGSAATRAPYRVSVLVRVSSERGRYPRTMRFSRVLASRVVAAALLALVGSFAACGGDDSGDDADGGGSDQTVSDAEWLRAADQTCADAQRAIDTIPTSNASLSDPQNVEQLSQAGEELGNLIVHLERLVQQLDDMAQPESSSDAEKANEVVDALGKALASLREAHRASTSGDAAVYPGAFETFTRDYGDYADTARSAGLEQCGKTIPE